MNGRIDLKKSEIERNIRIKKQSEFSSEYLGLENQDQSIKWSRNI